MPLLTSSGKVSQYKPRDMGVKPMSTEQGQPQLMAKSKRSSPRKGIDNIHVRPREHLTEEEVDKLRKAAKSIGRNTHRDDTLILVAFRHGLRVSEIVSLRWPQVDFNQAKLHVNRSKNGEVNTHNLQGPTLRALRELRRQHPNSAYVFLSETGTPLTIRLVHHIIARAGDIAKLGFTVHPHMLRHACGYYLACNGTDTRTIQGYLGHNSINSTTRYTALDPKRFDGLWPD